MKSRALFDLCGVECQACLLALERSGGHCLPLRSDEGASTMDTKPPSATTAPQHPQVLGTYQLEGLHLLGCWGGGLAVGLPVKNWPGAMRVKLL